MSTVFRWTLEEYENLAGVAERVFTDWRHPRHIELIYGYLKERGELAKLSLEEYERMIEAGVFAGPRRRLELINGEIREMSPIGDPHAEVVDRLDEWGHDCMRGKRIRVRIQNAVRLPHAASSPEPDVSWVVKRNYWRGKPGPKDILLIIEVADSSLEEDTGEKAVLYAGAGIRDYWVVNLRNQTIEVRRDPGPDGYQGFATYSGSDELRPLACPDAVLIPMTLWAPIPEGDEN
ncbi:MAG: Uma2 family endonuclease [Thermoguttaceae bacterium]